MRESSIIRLRSLTRSVSERGGGKGKQRGVSSCTTRRSRDMKPPPNESGGSMRSQSIVLAPSIVRPTFVSVSSCRAIVREDHWSGESKSRVRRGIIPSMYFRSEEHTSELQSRENLVCRLLLEK